LEVQLRGRAINVVGGLRCLVREPSQNVALESLAPMSNRCAPSS